MKGKWSVCLAAALTVAVGIGAGAMAGCGAKKETVNISGSTSMEKVMNMLVTEYTKTHKNVRINTAYNGSGAGIEAAMNGQSDIGLSSRVLKSTETTVEGVTLCTDGVALIVKAGVDLDNVSMTEVFDLFSATKTPIGSISQVVFREAESGTRSAFEELIKKDGVALKESELASNPIVANSSNIAVTTVAGNAAAMGYVSLDLLAANPQVKALSLDGVAPTVENIKNNLYKLSRPFVLVTKKRRGTLVCGAGIL